MKKAKDYIKYKASLLSLNDTEKADIYEVIKQAQQDAIKDTLKLAAERAESIEELANPYDANSGYPTVDKDTILSLKNELFKQLE